MQVREIMTKNPACCMPDSNLREVSKMMVENDCGCIPVVENQSNMKPVGTVTDRDITIRTVAEGKNPLEMKASDIMTTDVVTIKPETDVQHCANVMKENDIRRVLVVDDMGKCCGIVAQADVAEYGPNPTLISNVVHDISESAHTAVKSDSGNFNPQKSEGGISSLLNFSTVLPIAAGVAAGAAFKYFYGSESKPEKHDVEKYRVNHLKDKTPMPLENYKQNTSDETCEVIAVATITTGIDEMNSDQNKSFSDQENNETTEPGIGRSATH